MYDILIVGAGLYGAVTAHELTKRGRRCLVVDKRKHVGGNVYTENRSGINVHKYGAHIFHTSNREIWDYVRGFAQFNAFVNSPIAMSKGRLYNLPFNMNTFYQLWGVKTPSEARDKIAEQCAEYAHIATPRNLEEQALVLVGRDIYDILIREYTEKQWGRSARDIPAFIIKRLPVRFKFDNNYFSDTYQGIPIGGYTAIVNRMLQGSEVRLGIDFSKDRSGLIQCAKKVVYTGKIDEYFDFRLGRLQYRSLHFEHIELDEPDFQGNAVVNYCDHTVPYTRIIEHKHFEFGEQPATIITKEFPHEFSRDNEPYYPLNDADNQSLYVRYRELAAQERNVVFGGRLAEFKYYDMHQVVAVALERVHNLL